MINTSFAFTTDVYSSIIQMAIWTYKVNLHHKNKQNIKMLRKN